MARYRCARLGMDRTLDWGWEFECDVPHCYAGDQFAFEEVNRWPDAKLPPGWSRDDGGYRCKRCTMNGIYTATGYQRLLHDEAEALIASRGGPEHGVAE